MKEIYDEKYKGKERSNSKNSKKNDNDYTSIESYENIIGNSNYRKNTLLNSESTKNNNRKIFDINSQRKITIDEVSYSHKKPNLENKLYKKYNENSGKI
jgi:hypothetical protein